MSGFAPWFPLVETRHPTHNKPQQLDKNASEDICLHAAHFYRAENRLPYPKIHFHGSTPFPLFTAGAFSANSKVRRFPGLENAGIINDHFFSAFTLLIGTYGSVVAVHTYAPLPRRSSGPVPSTGVNHGFVLQSYPSQRTHPQVSTRT